MQARKHRKVGDDSTSSHSNRQPGVSRKNFTHLVETEAEKTNALLQISAAVERGNSLKEKELELLEKRNDIEQQRNDIEQQRNELLATFTDNIVIVSQQFYEIFKNK